MPIFKLKRESKIPDRCRIERVEGENVIIRCPRDIEPDEAIKIHDLRSGEAYKHSKYGLVCYNKDDHLICHVNEPSECPVGTYYVRKAPIWQEYGKYQCFVRKR